MDPKSQLLLNLANALMFSGKPEYQNASNALSNLNGTLNSRQPFNDMLQSLPNVSQDEVTSNFANMSIGKQLPIAQMLNQLSSDEGYYYHDESVPGIAGTDDQLTLGFNNPNFDYRNEANQLKNIFSQLVRSKVPLNELGTSIDVQNLLK